MLDVADCFGGQVADVREEGVMFSGLRVPVGDPSKANWACSFHSTGNEAGM